MDTYTKMILTVIAVCLTVIVLRDVRIIPDAQALVDIDGQPIQVIVSNIQPVKVRIESIKTGLRWKDGNLPVSIQEPLPVTIDR